MEKQAIFSLSTLFFFIKGNIVVDESLVKVKTSNTVLGIIPAGSNNQNIPLKNISSVQLNSNFKILPIIIGSILVFTGFANLTSSFLTGVVMMLIGLAVFGSGILTTLVLGRSGHDFYLSVPFYEKQKLMQAKDWIEEGLYSDANKTDISKHIDAQAKAQAEALSKVLEKE